MSLINYRTVDVDSIDPDSSVNFPLETLLPGNIPAPTTSSTAASIGSQVRQLLRSGDSEGALRHVLDTAPLGGDDRAKEVHLATVVEVLGGIRQGEMTRVLEGVCAGDGGAERGDCLMKYLDGFAFIWEPLAVEEIIAVATEYWIFTNTGPESWGGRRRTTNERILELA
ncbi:hypothetical protein RJZ90_002634 [Blastomyces dermatitidis]